MGPPILQKLPNVWFKLHVRSWLKRLKDLAKSDCRITRVVQPADLAVSTT